MDPKLVAEIVEALQLIGIIGAALIVFAFGNAQLKKFKKTDRFFAIIRFIRKNFSLKL